MVLSWSSFILLHGDSERKIGLVPLGRRRIKLSATWVMRKAILVPVEALLRLLNLQQARLQCFIKFPHLNLLRPSGEVADNWKLWKEKNNNYFFISRLDRESSPYQLAMFKQTVGDDALKVIKTFSYTEGEDSNNWRVVVAKMEKHCFGEVNEIYERYMSGTSFQPSRSIVVELKTLAKTCNFCDCLRDSLIRDRIVLGIKDEQTIIMQ